ncbi:Protein ARV1 [Pseudolycoriella hygida]|uniref:Protein ARV n=1 Tax=Pseudolycoriella hygida TaxID=35572 RepID=A0A9Q0MLA8_9DIPT|nr:Protein ARV1 [Pseudolycoriella hygida]
MLRSSVNNKQSCPIPKKVRFSNPLLMCVNNDRKISYVCINCGAEIEELHKKYSSSVLKIMSCETCKQVADKYIEFEPIIILIDLVLLSQPAFRHVMYNTKFKIYAKILVVQLLFESYYVWIDAPKPFDVGEFASEKEFYFSFLLTSLDYILLVLMLQLWTKATNGSSHDLSTIHFVKAMTLAKVAKFFMIPLVIWSSNASDSASLRLLLVNGYYFLSVTQVLSILTNSSRRSSAFMTLVTIIVKHIVIVELNQRLRNVVMI